MPKRTPVRLCLAAGPWHVLMLAAALLEARDRSTRAFNGKCKLVIWSMTSDDLRSFTFRLAQALDLWEEIIEDQGLLTEAPDEKEWPLCIDAICDNCRFVLDEPNVHELWVSHLENFGHRLLFSAYPNARIVMYEDGLMASMPMPLRSPYIAMQYWREWPALVLNRKWHAHFESLRLCDWRLDRRVIRRLKWRFGWLALRLPVPSVLAKTPLIPVRRETVSKLLSAAKTSLGIKEISHTSGKSSRRILVLSQFACRSINEAFQQFFAQYNALVGELVDAGYDVYWKEHPRSRNSFTSILQSNHGRDNIHSVEGSKVVPIEFIVKKGSFDACIAMNSSAVFYLQDLYGVTGYSCSDMFEPLCVNDRQLFALQLHANLFPSWRELLVK